MRAPVDTGSKFVRWRDPVYSPDPAAVRALVAWEPDLVVGWNDSLQRWMVGRVQLKAYRVGGADGVVVLRRAPVWFMTVACKNGDFRQFDVGFIKEIAECSLKYFGGTPKQFVDSLIYAERDRRRQARKEARAVLEAAAHETRGLWDRLFDQFSTADVTKEEAKAREQEIEERLHYMLENA